MFRERVADDIYVFTSDLYAQVTAGLIVTHDGAILVDTSPFPIEAKEIASFIPRVSPAVKYVILTHYHADHIYGAYLFPQADVVSHHLCRKLIHKRGRPALKKVQDQEPLLENVTLRLPDITFNSEGMGLQVGEKVVKLIHAPGHTEDLVMVYVEDDEVLFASDLLMPVPSIVAGNIEAYRASLHKVIDLKVNNLVQGHGEVVLVGEVKSTVETNLNYLDTIEKKVIDAIESGEGKEALRQDDIESTGLSRLPLHGQVQQIHKANLLALYDQMVSQ